MLPILENSILSFTLLSLITYPHFLLANTIPTKHPDSIRGNESDYEALLAIKASISDDPDSVLSSWNSSLHFCQWEGVTCGRRHQRVVSLDLSESKLVGTLSPFIGNLSFLRKIDLVTNSFRGGIPHQISFLPRLKALGLANNSFEGEIPSNLSRCLHLFALEFSHNKLEGRIPTLPSMEILKLDNNHFSGPLKDIGIGNMSSSLQQLYLHDNQLHGSIPDDFEKLKNLAYLTLDDNMLSGIIPTSVFNLSHLKELSFTSNKISGNLPQDLGLRLPQLQYLLIANTSLVGQVPTSLSNLSELINLDLSLNSFKGKFSFHGNNMPNLMTLNIGYAFSVGEARDLGFLNTLTNCTNLIRLAIEANSFTGTFPHSILNLSTSLQLLSIGNNQISGHVPFGLGRFVDLFFLDLQVNHFNGPIPADISKLQSLEVVFFMINDFSGEIPSLGNLTFLSDLYMAYNNLEGSLPTSVGNCTNLEKLYLQSNKFSGVLPVDLFHASSLFHLDISQNSFQGSLPLEISMLKNLVELDVSENSFSGEIPSSLGGCTALTSLDISRNSFVGPIPPSLSPLQSIQAFDLSCNHFSGQIPSYFSSWPYLSYLNLSFNNLEGEVPTNGVFANTSGVSVIGNSKLCGGVIELHLQRCPSPKGSKRRRLSLALIVLISIACFLIVILSIALCFFLLRSQRKRKDASSELQLINPFLEVSYQMLLRATNGFSPSNLIGVGGFGSVYKGNLLHQDGTESVVAVKVMKLQNEGAGKSFLAECRALRNIRHRNLVKIITACSSIDTQRNDFKALIYEFMSRGSLEGWLYPNHVTGEYFGDDQSCSLSLIQRLNIVIDVASALEYLHTGCADPIIHCDLKPSNILLDDQMIARVGDFGLAKFLSGASTSSITNNSSLTQVRGTVGYAAPEYGIGSKASVEGDIYSFGIVVLEMMTSKKPTEPMFSECLNLHEFVKAAFPDRVMEIIDQRMLGDANVLCAITDADIRETECIKSLVMVGVKCSLELPQDRMSINEVVNELKSARRNILPTLKRTYKPTLNSA